MAGRPSDSGRTRSYKTTTSTGGKKSSTRPFTGVNSRQSAKAKLAREKQRRQYEQQKREKLIFALFVVIILVMILFAILIFKKIVGDAPSETKHTTGTEAMTTGPDDPMGHAAFTDEMIAGDRVYQGSLIQVKDGERPRVAPALTNLQDIADRKYSISGIGGEYLETGAANAFAEMAAAQYAANGKKLNVQNCCAEGDKGEFSTGLLLDISLSVDGVTYLISDYGDVFDWLLANAEKYGFVMMSPEEVGRRHYAFRYVGVPHASYMKERSLTLSAYLDLLRASHEIAADGTGDTLSVTADGEIYEIYFVKSAGGDMTEVPVPEKALDFEISGNGKDGFIVTAHMGE